MTALYPVSVKTFTPHRDAVEYVLADHVNVLDDEVTSIETVLGTVPHLWTTNLSPAGFLPDLSKMVAFTSVKNRLDVLQQHLVAMEKAYSSILLPSGVIHGGHPPSASGTVTAIGIRNTGQTFPPSAYVWRTYDMSVADFDSDGSFTGGSNQPCPQTGWWMITATAWTDIPNGTAGTPHYVSNRMLLGNREVAAQNSTETWGSGGQHLINLSYSGVWTVGEPFLLQIQQYPTPSSADVWSHAQIGFTYIRPTV